MLIESETKLGDVNSARSEHYHKFYFEKRRLRDDLILVYQIQNFQVDLDQILKALKGFKSNLLH